MTKLFLLLGTVLFIPLISSAQQGVKKEYTHYTHFWTAYDLEQKLSERFRVGLDAAYRRQSVERGSFNILQELHWYGFRAWASIEISEKLIINFSPFAYFYEIPPTHDKSELHQWQDEIRFSIRAMLGEEDGIITHRYGLERRYRRNYNDEYWKEYRIRYMLRFKKQLINKYSLVIDEEIFINMGEDIAYNIFDQNRFFLGLQREVSPQLLVTAGYHNILDHLSSGDEFLVIHALQLTFTFRNLFPGSKDNEKR